MDMLYRVLDPMLKSQSQRQSAPARPAVRILPARHKRLESTPADPIRFPLVSKDGSLRLPHHAGKSIQWKWKGGKWGLNPTQVGLGVSLRPEQMMGAFTTQVYTQMTFSKRDLLVVEGAIQGVSRALEHQLPGKPQAKGTLTEGRIFKQAQVD